MGDEPVEHDPRDGEAARREDSTAWQDATLRRPALDPAIPRAARDLLRARRDVLTPAPPGSHGRLGLLPARPEGSEATVSNAVAGLTTVLFVAIAGATPWAVGAQVFQQPVSWQSAAGRYGLLLAELIIAVTAVAFGSRVARFGELRVEDEAVAAARTYRGRYLTGADLDARARVLLRRAQDAINAINAAAIVRDDLLDELSTSASRASRSGRSRSPCASRHTCARCVLVWPSRHPARPRPSYSTTTGGPRGRPSRAPPTGSPRSSATRPRSTRLTTPTATGASTRPSPSSPARPRPARPHRRRRPRHRRTRCPHRARPRPPPVLPETQDYPSAAAASGGNGQAVTKSAIGRLSRTGCSSSRTERWTACSR